MKIVSCDLCNFQKPRLLVSARGSGMVECSRCGLWYRPKRPTGEELNAIYGNEWYFTGRYQQGNERVKTDYLRDKLNIMRFVRRRYATISKYKKRGRILDIGAAMGFYLEYFQKRGWKVSGIEYSRFAAEYAQHELDIQDMFIGDVDVASYKPKTFDVVTLWLIIEHLVDPCATLKRIRHWLKDGAILGIKTPHAGGITARLNPRQWFKQHPEDHNIDFTVTTLQQMLEKVGFEVLEYETEGIYLDRACKAIKRPLPRDHRLAAALNNFYQNLAKKLLLGDSLVMFARKR